MSSIPKQDMGLPGPRPLLDTGSSHFHSNTKAGCEMEADQQALGGCHWEAVGWEARQWQQRPGQWQGRALYFLLKNNYDLIWEIISLSLLNWNKLPFWYAFRKAVHITTHHFSFYHDTWDKFQTVWQEDKEDSPETQYVSYPERPFLISVSEMNPQL